MEDVWLASKSKHVFEAASLIWGRVLGLMVVGGVAVKLYEVDANGWLLCEEKGRIGGRWCDVRDVGFWLFSILQIRVVEWNTVSVCAAVLMALFWG